MYQCGYMHRDISIGNLLKLIIPALRKQFHITNATKLVEALTPAHDQNVHVGIQGAVREKVEALRRLAMESDDAEQTWTTFYRSSLLIQRQAQQVMEKVKGLNVGTLCNAIVSDADQASYLPTYFEKRHDNGTISVCGKQTLACICADCEL